MSGSCLLASAKPPNFTTSFVQFENRCCKRSALPARPVSPAPQSIVRVFTSDRTAIASSLADQGQLDFATLAKLLQESLHDELDLEKVLESQLLHTR